jgi:hypothetical protein
MARCRRRSAHSINSRAPVFGCHPPLWRPENAMSRPCRNWLSSVRAIARCYRCRRLRQISVAGCPEPVEALRGAATGRIDEERKAHQQKKLASWQNTPISEISLADRRERGAPLLSRFNRSKVIRSLSTASVSARHASGAKPLVSSSRASPSDAWETTTRAPALLRAACGCCSPGARLGHSDFRAATHRRGSNNGGTGNRCRPHRVPRRAGRSPAIGVESWSRRQVREESV